jgi:hypothetical protein
MELVGIDYQTGATGQYLAYIGNVFLFPTIPFHNPFTKNGSSHNAMIKSYSKFRPGHYWLNGKPFAMKQFEDLFKLLDKIIWIDIAPQDFDKFTLVKNNKGVCRVDGSDDLSDRTLIFNDSMKPAWVQDKSAFLFNWGSLFSEEKFLSELNNICNFCDIKFCLTDQLIGIHREFLVRHSYIL